jgi:hypothetical protein
MPINVKHRAHRVFGRCMVPWRSAPIGYYNEGRQKVEWECYRETDKGFRIISRLVHSQLCYRGQRPMDASNGMMDGERVRAGLDCSAPHLYCASSSEPMRCSQVLCCVVGWSVCPKSYN